MSVQDNANEAMKLKDGQILYNDLRNRVEKLTRAIAPDYADLTFPVEAGTLCSHENKVYSAKTDIQTSEDWTAAHWEPRAISAEMNGDISAQLAKKAPVIVLSATGDVASFDGCAPNTPLFDCVAQITPVQDLNGYDAPWAPGAGKNMFNADDQVEGYYINADGVVTAEANNMYSNNIPVVEGNTYTLSFKKNSTASRNYRMHGYDSNGNWVKQVFYFSQNTIKTISKSFAVPSGVVYLKFSHNSDISDIQLEEGDTATDYAPYSNICAISGWNGCNIVNANGTDSSAEDYVDAEYVIDWTDVAGTIFGGAVNPITGVLVATMGVIASYAGETLTGIWLSDRDAYAAGATPTTGAQVVYALDNPIVYPLNPIEIRTLAEGTNYISANTGDVSVQYVVDTKQYIDVIGDEVARVKSDLQALGLTVADGKLCITVEDDTEEEGE